MQAKGINDQELVKQCMEEVCKKAGFADSSRLVQRDLEYLCDSIEATSGILISLSTIKRLLNGQFSRQPQIATLNAMASYLGYHDWQAYRSTKQASIPGSTQDVSQWHRAQRRKFTWLNYLFLGGGLLVTALALLAALKSRKPALPGNIEKASFSAVKTTSNDLPNSVVFKYNIDDVDADSFFIQQSWDYNRRVRIYKHNYTLTDIYYEPGYHTAKLIANDKIIKTQPVSIPTDKWLFYAHERIPGYIPKYISATGVKDGMLQLDKSDLLNNQVDISKDNNYVNVFFPSNMQGSADNYTLKCRVKVKTVKNNACPFLMCEIYSQSYFMYFINSSKGCISNLRAQFGENFVDGKTTDLSNLGANVNEWQDLELTVKNKQVSIKVNNKEAFSTSYNESCGLITGLGFISNGLCQVDYVDIKSLDGKIILTDDFNR